MTIRYEMPDCAYNGAVLYITSTDNKARFALGNLGTKNLVIFGINPSTATDQVFDQTIRRIDGYSHAHGFDGWLMLNLYPQRATDPNDLHADIDASMNRENIDHIKRSLALAGDATLCAAWGQLIRQRSYLVSCLERISNSLNGYSWHSIGTPTKEGHPRHPLYARTEWALCPFDISAYLKELKQK